MSEQSFGATASRGTAPAPSYIVGQDAEGHWLAVEQHGLGGGIFVSKEAALRYVGFETGHRPGTCQVASEPVGLWAADTSWPVRHRNAA